MKTMTRIVIKDRGYNALLAEMKKSNKSLVVGVMEKEGGAYQYKNGGQTVYDIAVRHEFGDGVPERPFLSGTIDAHQNTYKEWARKVAIAIIDKKETIFTGLSKLGMKVVTDIQERIIAGIPPDNSDAVKARKEKKRAAGNTWPVVPLIDTGHLIKAITYEVREGSPV